MVEPSAPNQRRIRNWGRSLRYVVYLLGIILLAQTVADIAATRLPLGDVLFRFSDARGPATAGRGFSFVMPAPDHPVIVQQFEQMPVPGPNAGAPRPQPEALSPEQKKDEGPPQSPQTGVTPAPAPNSQTDRVFVFRTPGPGPMGPMPFTLPLPPPPGFAIDCEDKQATDKPATGNESAPPTPEAKPNDGTTTGKPILKDCVRTFRAPDGVAGVMATAPMGPGMFFEKQIEPLPVSPQVAQNALIAVSLIQFLVGIAALAALYRLCRHYEAGQLFSADNARLYRRLGLWLIAFSAIAIVVPVVRWVSLYAGAPVPPPFDWRFLAVDLWLSPYLIFAVVGIFVLLLGRVMAETASLAEDAKLTI